jgi:uncharacterized protein YcnI
MASAHVTVQPKETTQGAYEVFTVRVPTEKETATTKVIVDVPKEATVSRIQPQFGWKGELVKDKDGVVTQVVWTATEGGFAPGEFGEFKMSAKVDAEATTITWKAHQTYQDGTVVDWVGAADAEVPASVTTVKAAAADTDEHGSHEAEEPKEDNTAVIISIAALAVSVIALLIAVFKRKK